MKTLHSTYNSCLYPHPLLTIVNPHAHEDIHSRTGVTPYSIFRIFASEGHDYPLPPVRVYHRGHTPYLLDFQPFSLRAAFLVRASLLTRLRMCVWFGGVYILRYNRCRSDETASEQFRGKTYCKLLRGKSV